MVPDRYPRPTAIERLRNRDVFGKFARGSERAVRMTKDRTCTATAAHAPEIVTV